MTEHHRSYSAVFPILLREGPAGREVLLHLRQNTGYQDGTWDIAGSGHVDAGETARQALVRESREELLLSAEPEDAVFAHLCHRPENADGRSYYDIYFFLPRYRGEPAIGEPEKCAELRWFSVDALPENMPPTRRDALLHALRGEPYSEYPPQEKGGN